MQNSTWGVLRIIIYHFIESVKHSKGAMVPDPIVPFIII